MFTERLIKHLFLMFICFNPVCNGYKTRRNIIIIMPNEKCTSFGVYV